MGKSLIIKGANFSQVSIPVDVDLTPSENSGFQGYWSKDSGTFNNHAWKSFIIPTVVGRTYRITNCVMNTTIIVALSTNSIPSDGAAPAGIITSDTGAAINWQTKDVVATNNYLSFTSSVYSDGSGAVEVIELAEE